MVPHGSLNSWNQWINHWPLYQSLFWPLLWKLHQKVKFRLLRHNDLWHLGFQNGKKDENSDFMEIFSFSISNIFVELLVTHIKLYIYSERTPSALLKNGKQSHFKISYQNLKGFQNGKSLKITNLGKVLRPGTQCSKNNLFQNLIFKRIRLCLSENYYGNLKHGCSSVLSYWTTNIFTIKKQGTF